jgi:hypothetical protein
MIVSLQVKMECGHFGWRPTHDSLLPLKGKLVVCEKCSSLKLVVEEKPLGSKREDILDAQ